MLRRCYTNKFVSLRYLCRCFSTSLTRYQRESSQTLVKLSLDHITVIRPERLKSKESPLLENEINPRKQRAPRKRKSKGDDEQSAIQAIEPENPGMLDQFGDQGGKTLDNSLTDFYQGIKDIIDHYGNKEDGRYVVLVQVGSFYELYFDQASKFAGLLGLTLTKKKLKIQEVAFSGFPDYKLDKYLQIIFSQGLKAVVCDQKLDKVKNVIERPISRLVTPGTVIDDGLRDFHRTNYLLSISFPEDPFKVEYSNLKIGLCWADVSLGHFFVLETNFNDLMANITRINPSEILINSSVDVDSLIGGRWFPELGDLKKYYVTGYSVPSTKKRLHDYVERFAENKKLTYSHLESLTTKETSAASMVLHYLDECLPSYKFNFELPKRSLPDTLMHIDPRAAQDLELTETIRGGFRVGALANIIDRTVTDPGSRLLNTWLLAPSTDIKDIAKRQSYVSAFLKNEAFVEDILLLLKRTSDINRIIRRVDNGRAELSEYTELSDTILLVEELRSMIEQTPDSSLKNVIMPLFEEFSGSSNLLSLANRIKNTINPKTMFSKPDNNKLDTDITRNTWSVQPDVTSNLKVLRGEYDKLLSSYDSLNSTLKEEFESYGYSGSLKLIRDLRSWEYVVELRSSSKLIPSILKDHDLKYKEKTKTSVKLINEEWRKLGPQLVKLEEAITLEELLILDDLKNTILDANKELSKVSPIIELLDATISFTSLAREKNLICPKVDKSDVFIIEEGRHLVVEEGLKGKSIGVENFTSNSCDLHSSKSWIITGPNMGGKSTFLRQNALIAILAQMGSFVPAKSAHIGVIDKVFTRVGSSDNIYRHQSTFMVEMNETAVILRDSTPKSLAIVDELGRGTSTSEGIAIAFASLSHLIKINNCKVLFATHYGPELEKLILEDEELKNKVEFYHTNLSKVQGGQLPIDEKIIFDHKLTKGISYHSHALEIAELAGFPRSALDTAKNSFGKLIR